MMAKNKLLVVVDMQKDFVTGVLGTGEAQAIVPGLVQYVKDFEGDVVFTRDTHHENYLSTLEGKHLPVVHCIQGSEGWDIIPELQELTEGKEIFDKPTFGSIALSEMIQQSTYDEIYVCGVCTGICVISNAMLAKAVVPDTPVKVVKDICACVTPDSHEIALNAINTCQIDIV